MSIRSDQRVKEESLGVEAQVRLDRDRAIPRRQPLGRAGQPAPAT
jgi:hypothetical protein